MDNPRIKILSPTLLPLFLRPRFLCYTAIGSSSCPLCRTIHCGKVNDLQAQQDHAGRSHDQPRHSSFLLSLRQHTPTCHSETRTFLPVITSATQLTSHRSHQNVNAPQVLTSSSQPSSHRSHRNPRHLLIQQNRGKIHDQQNAHHSPPEYPLIETIQKPG